MNTILELSKTYTISFTGLQLWVAIIILAVYVMIAKVAYAIGKRYAA